MVQAHTCKISVSYASSKPTSTRKKNQAQNPSVLPTDSCPNISVQTQPGSGLPPVSALCVIARSWALFCHCSASCHCCHDPFIVRSAQTCPPLTGFSQPAHPSRCSRSTLTTVCFCAFDSGSAAPSSCSGVWDPWSVESQSCKLAML